MTAIRLFLSISILTFTSISFAAVGPSACEAYAQAAAKAEGISFSRIVDPTKTQLTQAELGMVQTALLTIDPKSALTPDAALTTFKDDDTHGEQSGTLNYVDLQVGNSMTTFVKVTYYPGDNEYGALFTYAAQKDQLLGVSLVGLIKDSDIYCMLYRH